MFTGIVEEVGAVSRRSGADVAILAERVLEGLSEGDSIAVDGACLTVVSINDDGFVAQISPETMERTTLSALRPGDAVNLERALALGDRLGGHVMQGHVDGVGRVYSDLSGDGTRIVGGATEWRLHRPGHLERADACEHVDRGRHFAPRAGRVLDRRTARRSRQLDG